MFSITFSHKSPISYHIIYHISLSLYTIIYTIVIYHHHLYTIIYHVHIKVPYHVTSARLTHLVTFGSRADARHTAPFRIHTNQSLVLFRWPARNFSGTSTGLGNPWKSIIKWGFLDGKLQDPGDFNRKPHGSPRTWGNSWTFKRL